MTAMEHPLTVYCGAFAARKYIQCAVKLFLPEAFYRFAPRKFFGVKRIKDWGFPPVGPGVADHLLNL